jgi:hypothetical protein
MYYPKSQIKTNLYTNGGEYSTSTDNQPYQGYYYEISSGQQYTGKNPQDGPNILLTPPQDKPNFDPTNKLDNPDFNSVVQYYGATSAVYDSITNTNTTKTRLIPQSNITLPTPQDNQNGQFNRYFCKKTNELKYLEIDKNTYQKLQNKDPQIAWDLYNPVQIIWIIQGNQEQVYNSNKGSVISIEQNKGWISFSQYFKNDFSKYYLGS